MENRKLEKEFENICKRFSYTYGYLTDIKVTIILVLAMVMLSFIMKNMLMIHDIKTKLNNLQTIKVQK